LLASDKSTLNEYDDDDTVLCVCLLHSTEISTQLQSMMQSHCSEAMRLLQLTSTTDVSQHASS